MIGPDFLTAIAAILGAIAALAVGVWGLVTKARRDGRKTERERNALEQAETYRETRKRIDQAARDADGADGVEWLRERGKQ